MSGRHRRLRRGPALPGSDAVTEQPDLVEADRRARAERAHWSGGPPDPAGSRRTRRDEADPGRAASRPARRGAGASGRAGDGRAGGTDDVASAGSPMIDPRIAARRRQVEADSATRAGRRRGRRILGVVAAAVLLAAGPLALLSPLVGVRAVEVAGAPRSGAAQVRSASGLEPGSPLVRIDVEGAARRIEALPWVRRATLERRWPHTVVVTVEERQAAAVAPCRTAPPGCLVDREGRVLAPFEPEDQAAAALPRLVGVPVAGEPGTMVAGPAQGPLAVASALPGALLPLVTGVRGEGAEVTLDLAAPGRATTPPTVRLGRPERVPEKLTAAATVLARTSVNAVAVLDVRVPEFPALTRISR